MTWYKTNMNNFLLHSGERQTAPSLHKIRKDHVARYTLVAKNLIRLYNRETFHLNGLDCFCGNGYGTYVLSENLKCTMTGIDASGPAIGQAGRQYSTSRTKYETRVFPFELDENTYDFAASLESIEHVEDSEALLFELTKSLKPNGYLFASVPNAAVLSLEKNPNKFHYRHFTYMDFLGMAKNVGLSPVTFYGQNTYILSDDGVVDSILPYNKMNLEHGNKTGQFLFFILKKE